MGSDGDDVGQPAGLPQSRTEQRLASLEADRERLERDVNALRGDLIRLHTESTEERRHVDARMDAFGREIHAAEGRILAVIGKRNDLLAKLCDHSMKLGASLGEAPVRVLREVRQSWFLSAGFAVLTIAASAWMLGLDITEIAFGEHYGVKFEQKPGNDGPADFGEPVKAEAPQP